MFHMLSCFSFIDSADLANFQQNLDSYSRQLIARDLLVETGPVGERHSDTILDTADDSTHTHFMIMSFTDRAQADRAVQLIEQGVEPVATVHKAVYSRISEPVFICWQDVD